MNLVCFALLTCQIFVVEQHGNITHVQFIFMLLQMMGQDHFVKGVVRKNLYGLSLKFQEPSSFHLI